MGKIEGKEREDKERSSVTKETNHLSRRPQENSSSATHPLG
jgi:hypothetical protein